MSSGRSGFVVAVRIVAAALVLLATAHAGSLAEWKKDWNAAKALPDWDARQKREVALLEELRGPGTIESARLVLPIALDDEVAWTVHDASVAVLASMTSDAVRVWAQKLIASSDDASTRALLCSIVATHPPEESVRALSSALRDASPVVQAAAADALATIRRKEVVSALIAALEQASTTRAKDDLCGALFRLTRKKLKEPVEWRSWWTAEQEAFVFPIGVHEPREAAELSVPRTTSDGSGLYDRITSERVVFIVDVSLSMTTKGKIHAGTSVREATRLEYVQKELAAAIEGQLGPKTKFNVVAFGTKVTSWKSGLVTATEDNRKAARDWVLALAPQGNTNTHGALVAALADKAVDTIYLLSDGMPTVGEFTRVDSILGEIRKLNDTRKVRIHTIGYLVGHSTKYEEDKPTMRRFLRRIAEESGGTVRIFEEPK